MRKPLITLGVALAVMTLSVANVSVASAAPPPSASAKPACVRPHAPGLFSQSFTFEGKTRTYQLYVPHRYTGKQRVPVVFEFHGAGSNAIQQVVYGDFTPESERDGFLIVAPDGQGNPLHFNISNEPGLQSDITMGAALADHIESMFCIDTAREYATGMSSGAGETIALACVYPNRFAAFGPVAATGFVSGCGLTHPVSMAAFQGTADPIVPYNGGPLTGPAPANMAQWAAHDGCASRFVDTRLGTEVIRRSWHSCAGHSRVDFYIIVGGGHTWPGSRFSLPFGLTTHQIDASAAIWHFFRAHPLVAGA
jgi:polyhydroxybutyrate depolymerase